MMLCSHWMLCNAIQPDRPPYTSARSVKTTCDLTNYDIFSELSQMINLADFDKVVAALCDVANVRLSV